MPSIIVKTNNHNQDGFSTPVFPRPTLSALLEPWKELWGQPEPNSSLGFPVEILDSENELALSAELPGVGKENIEISYNEQTLTIAAEKLAVEKVAEKPEEGTEEQQQPQWRILRGERSVGKFERKFRLPIPVDFEAAQAKYVDGVLSLNLPKLKKSSEKKIVIQ